MAADMAGPTIWVWRHPPAIGTEGRCIGTSDVPVDRRKAKHLARRVQRFARNAGLPSVVFTSNLRRCAEVGRWLRRWGWIHRIDPALAELDFGAWEGRAWSDIDRSDVDAWCADFFHHRPGGGESLRAMLERAASWRPTDAAIVIGHAGWMLARRWLQEGREAPATAADWPASPSHGQLWKLSEGVVGSSTNCGGGLIRPACRTSPQPPRTHRSLHASRSSP